LAITIRNKETEELIRMIGRRTGEGPSAVIRRLAEKEAGENPTGVPEAEVQRRIAAFEAIAKEYPPPDPKPSWAEIEWEMDKLFDEGPDEGRVRRAAKRS
jgi:hypothetical protein